MANYGVKANPKIRPIGIVTDADIENIRECLAAELTIADTARKLGLSSNQVTKAKRKHGLTSVTHHDNTAGTEAFATRARRNRLARYEDLSEINLLSRGTLIRVLKGELAHKAILRGMGGSESLEEIDGLPARDLREWAGALVQLESALVKIEDKEDDNGLTRALSMLEKFTEAAAAISGAMPPPREGLIQS